MNKLKETPQTIMENKNQRQFLPEQINKSNILDIL